MSIGFALALILVLIEPSLIMVIPERASAQIPTLTPTPPITPNPTLIPTPTPVYPKLLVPEFTVKLVDNSYDVPTTHSIDPYTGQNITNPGYHVENKTIEVTVKNQPFTPFYAVDSFNASFYYNIRTKGIMQKTGPAFTVPMMGIQLSQALIIQLYCFIPQITDISWMPPNIMEYTLLRVVK